jgi:hypothetical protein
MRRGKMDEEQIIAEATEIHDRECNSCDRKYRMSCPKMAIAILSLNQKKSSG